MKPDLISLARAFYQNDRTKLLDMLHADFQLHLAEGLPDGLGGVYVGRAAALGALRRVREALSCRPEPQRFLSAESDHVVVQGHYFAAITRSGKPLEALFIHLLHFEGGKLTQLWQVTDTQRWTEALTPVEGQGLRGDKKL